MLQRLAGTIKDQNREQFMGMLSLLPFKLVEVELKQKSWSQNSWEVVFYLSESGKAVLNLLKTVEN